MPHCLCTYFVLLLPAISAAQLAVYSHANTSHLQCLAVASVTLAAHFRRPLCPVHNAPRSDKRQKVGKKARIGEEKGAGEPLFKSTRRKPALPGPFRSPNNLYAQCVRISGHLSFYIEASHSHAHAHAHAHALTLTPMPFQVPFPLRGPWDTTCPSFPGPMLNFRLNELAAHLFQLCDSPFFALGHWTFYKLRLFCISH